LLTDHAVVGLSRTSVGSVGRIPRSIIAAGCVNRWISVVAFTTIGIIPIGIVIGRIITIIGITPSIIRITPAVVGITPSERKTPSIIGITPVGVIIATKSGADTDGQIEIWTSTSRRDFITTRRGVGLIKIAFGRITAVKTFDTV
jgi:hypothetical protein